MIATKEHFLEIISKQRALLDSLGIQSNDPLRTETQVESLFDFSQCGNLEELRLWFLAQQQTCKMSVEVIPLQDCIGWSFNRDAGNITHSSGDFFVVEGLRTKFSDRREVIGGWDQPILRQVGYDGGLLGLLRKKINGIPHYLIEAKAEPGNPDKVQISPTLQATFSNLNQSHGGSRPRFADIFECPDNHHGHVLFSQWMSEDGGRLYLKRNKGMLVEVPESALVEFPENFKWVSLYQLKALIKENSWVNPHIRSIISHL